ncbi:hypothetical protein SAMN05518683_1067 [Salibacterium halotolerans]|uniref:Uncharacterized protein n=1 Tax=Salibacterium halotolerans TaxID=1884432 RepID=A0A1I5QRN1_9BACI|nr:hypothetical protein SAMN05518683_1067 [Salibacterium halotolerans]
MLEVIDVEYIRKEGNKKGFSYFDAAIRVSGFFPSL